jgi:hypothetical protein
MTISFAGIADDVSASATGLSKVGGGRYNMSPGENRNNNYWNASKW